MFYIDSFSLDENLYTSYVDAVRNEVYLAFNNGTISRLTDSTPPQITNFVCDSSINDVCSFCLDPFYCIKCKSPYYQLNGQCLLSCPS
jgi:hypothetical protein